MINFDNVTKEIIKEYNPNWPQIPVHPYRIIFLINKKESTGLKHLNDYRATFIEYLNDMDDIYKDIEENNRFIAFSFDYLFNSVCFVFPVLFCKTF